MDLILASGSPRRRELLAQAGYRFSVAVSGISEPDPEPGVPVERYVAELAFLKAYAVARNTKRGVILSADTACDIDGTILNQPRDRADADRMLRLQEGKVLEVWTGVCVLRAESRQWVGASERSSLRFRPLSNEEREAYLDSGAWRGKAGGYGVQDDDPFVTVIAGSWSNVVGLPMERLASILEETRFLLGIEDNRAASPPC
jgi:septum formation protein